MNVSNDYNKKKLSKSSASGVSRSISIDSDQSELTQNESKHITSTLGKLAQNLSSLFSKESEIRQAVGNTVSNHERVKDQKETISYVLKGMKNVHSFNDIPQSTVQTEKKQREAELKQFAIEQFDPKSKKEESSLEASPLVTKFKLWAGKLATSIATSDTVGAILKSKTVRGMIKSCITTFSRVKPENILVHAGSRKEDISRWAIKLESLDQEMKAFSHSDPKFQEEINKGLFKYKDVPGKIFIKIHRHKLAFIQDKLTQIEDKHSDDYRFLKTLEKSFKVRLALKENIAEAVKDAHSLAAKMEAVADLDKLSHPYELLKSVVDGLKDNSETGLRTAVLELINTPHTSSSPNPFGNMLREVIGDDGIAGIQLLLSKEGLEIADTLLSFGTPDLLLQFLEDPIGTLVSNRDMLQGVAKKVLDHMDVLLGNEETGPMLIAMSKGKLNQADIDLLRQVFPLARDSFLEMGTASDERLSKASRVMGLIAGHIGERLQTGDEVELKQSLTVMAHTVDETAASLSRTISAFNQQELIRDMDVKDALPEEDDEDPTIFNEWLWSCAPVDCFTSAVSGVYQSSVNIVTSAYNTVVDAGTSVTNMGRSVVTGTAATLASKLIDKEVNSFLYELPDYDTQRPVDEAVAVQPGSVGLNKEKLNDLLRQTSVLACSFINQNPRVLDSVGAVVGEFLLNLTSTLSDPNATPDDRLRLVTESLGNSFRAIGESIVQSDDDPLAQHIGRTIASVGDILNTDFISISLSKSKVLEAHTLSEFHDVFREKLQEKIQEGLDGNTKKVGYEKKKGIVGRQVEHLKRKVVDHAGKFVVKHGENALPISQNGTVASLVSMLGLSSVVESTRETLGMMASLLTLR